jgi:ribosomal protein S18 acetylase RimI-like enzyme
VTSAQSASVCTDELTIETTFDANLLAAVHADTVNFAYSQFFPPDAVSPSVEEHRLTWIERLCDPTAKAFVARRHGEPLGTVLIRADPDFEAEGQIVGLHVLPAVWRQGVGGALHDHALVALRERGYRKAGLWVIAQNNRARALYDSRGWLIVPGVELHVHGNTEVRYRHNVA